MARHELITCDWCKELGYAPTEATNEVKFTIEGLYREWDLCDPHYRPFDEILFIARKTGEAAASEPAAAQEAPPQVYVERVPQEAPAEVSAPYVDPRVAEMRSLDVKLAGLRQELGLSTPSTHQLPAAPTPPPEAPAALFPSAPEAKPPKDRKPIPKDGKQRVRCLECSEEPVMMRSSASQHARLIHGKDARDTTMQGIGFRLKYPPLPGTKERGVPSVICLETHGKECMDPYWVTESKRSSHARSSHADKANIADVNYLNKDGIYFPVRCKEHPWCAQHEGGLGYGFINEHAHKTHMMKERQRAERQRLAQNNQT